MTNVFDIDERAGSYEPVVVKFRGQEYVLGGTASELISATAVYTSSPKSDEESETEYSIRLVAPVLRAVSNEIAEVLNGEGLTPAEEMAFIPVLTEVMKRLGALRFR